MGNVFCSRCDSDLTPAMARSYQAAPDKPRVTLCESCHTDATIQGGARFNTRGVLVRQFQYRMVRLSNEGRGMQATEDDLNRLGAAGWRIVPAQFLGGWAVMEREATGEYRG